MSIAHAAASRGLREVTESTVQRLTETGAQEVYARLGCRLNSSGNYREALNWLRQAPDGDGHAAFHLAEILIFDRDEHDSFDRRSQPGLTKNKTRISEVESLCRLAIAEGEVAARLTLALALVARRDYSAARSIWLQELEKADDPGKRARIAANISRSFDEEGSSAKAIEYIELAATEAIDVELILSYARHLKNLGGNAKAERIIRSAADDGSVDAMSILAEIMAAKGRQKEAEEWHQKATLSGVSPKAERSYAAFLMDHGRHEEALAAVPDFRVSDDGAESAYLSGLILKELRRLDEAGQAFLFAANNGHVQAKCEYGQALILRARFQEAESALREAASSGHTHANCIMGNLFERQGRFDEAVGALKKSYEGGHNHAAGDVLALLLRLNRGKDAAAWKRRTETARNGEKRGNGVRRSSRRRRR